LLAASPGVTLRLQEKIKLLEMTISAARRIRFMFFIFGFTGLQRKIGEKIILIVVAG